MSPSSFDTHEVTNQPPPLPPRNLFDADPILYGAIEPQMDQAAEESLSRHGAFWGSLEARELARLANANPAHLRAFDGQGRRIDVVEHHPAYHALMRRGAEAGLGVSFREPDGPDLDRTALMRACRLYMAAETEAGHLFPWSATAAASAALANAPDFDGPWLGAILARRYDHRLLPPSAKLGLTLSAGWTEKQAPIPPWTTKAEATADGRYRLVGHKWFVTGPMADGMLVLADAPGGPTAFLVPRYRADETLNRVRFQRLKTTAGLKSCAFAEAEFAGAEAILVGSEGDGTDILAKLLIDLQLDAAVIGTGLMRGAVAEVMHHVEHRASSGTLLIDRPLVTRVLADLSLDVAAAVALVMRLATAADRAAGDSNEAAFLRLVVPAAKYWIGKLAPAVAAECIECIGGNGYVEDGDLARAYRDAPAVAQWGLTANAAALEILAVIEEIPEAIEVALAEIAADLGKQVSPEVIRQAAAACADDPGSARILVEQLAVTSAAAALHHFAPRPITDAFLDTRISGSWRTSYGMLDGRYDAKGIARYAYPALT